MVVLSPKTKNLIASVLISTQFKCFISKCKVKATDTLIETSNPGVIIESVTWLIPQLYEGFENNKEGIRICKTKNDRKHNGQKKKDKHRSTKHYTEN